MSGRLLASTFRACGGAVGPSRDVSVTLTTTVDAPGYTQLSASDASDPFKTKSWSVGN